MNNYYVYIYHNENGIPYYIGKGKNNRIKEHLSNARTGIKYPLADKIRSLWKIGKEPLFQKVVDNISESSAFAIEADLISSYKRRIDGGLLLNLSIGGEKSASGCIPHNKGVPCTDEQKSNISKKLIDYYSTRPGPRKGAEGYKYWSNPKSNIAAWSKLNIFYDYFLLGVRDRTLSRIFPEITRMTFKTILIYFNQVGNPMDDPDWVDFYNKTPQTKIKEQPFYIKGFVYSEGLENSESILKLVNQGFGFKTISNKLKLHTGAVNTIYKDIKNGWQPENDQLYRFALNRKIIILEQDKETNDNTT